MNEFNTFAVLIASIDQYGLVLFPFIGPVLLFNNFLSFLSGYQTREKGTERLVLTLTNLLTKWPRETSSGFLVHFTNRNLEILSEFSTIDTSECVLGALFAGNYFGGEVRRFVDLKDCDLVTYLFQVMDLATQLKDATQWSDAIRGWYKC